MTCKPERWSVEEAAEFLKMTPEALMFLGDHGIGPARNGVGWFLDYDPDDVRDWLWSSGRPIAVSTRITGASNKRYKGRHRA